MTPESLRLLADVIENTNGEFEVSEKFLQNVVKNYRNFANLQKLLNERDAFIVKQGLWQTFVDSLPRRSVEVCLQNDYMIALADVREIVRQYGLPGIMTGHEVARHILDGIEALAKKEG